MTTPPDEDLPSLEEILTEVGAGQSGVLLHGPDGRSYFLPTTEADRFAVPHSPELESFRSKRTKFDPVRRDAGSYCDNLLNYLENHEINDQWRRVSILFVNRC